jgi:hypothetical protein
MVRARVRSMCWVIVAAVMASVPACRFQAPPATGDDVVEPDAAIDAPRDVAIDGPRTDWWDASWTRRRPITIDTSKLTGPVTNFPLLVQLAPDLIDLGGSHSDELRFLTADNTTVLPYELDTVDDAATSSIWVRLPALMNTGAAPTLWLYYANTGAARPTDSATVFSDRYVSVHHLGTSAGTSLPDSTGKDHTASAPSTIEMPALVDVGRIGRARDFDCSNDYLELATEVDYDFNNLLWVSVWILLQYLFFI